MSIEQKSGAVVNLAEADHSAKTRPHDDINSPVGSCPASQSQVFVVPVRYAFSEEAATHSACQPGVAVKSHAMAARRLRSGFLYVWQNKGPLKRYAVAAQGLLEPQTLDEDDTYVVKGSLAGLPLNKLQETWLLYTEQPLDAKHCQQLEDRSERNKFMRSFDLCEVASQLQAPHCPPLTEADQVIAELMPDTFVWALASDQQRNGKAYREGADKLGELAMRQPTQANIKAYTDAMRWNKEREDLTALYPDARESGPAPGEWSAEAWEALRTRDWLEDARQQAQGLWAVFACLDDDLGMLRDVNHEQEQVEIAHARWQEQYNLHLSIGGFIRSLVTEQPDDIAAQLNYRYREHDIQITPEQGQTLLDSNRTLAELRGDEARISIARGRQYSHEHAERLLTDVRAKRQEAVEPVKSFIPPELYDDVESVVREYRKDKAANLKNHHLSAKVGEFIDLQAMDTWLDQTAPAHYQEVEARHTALYADRALYLSRHKSGTWFVDYTNAEDRSWLATLAMACLSAQCSRSQGAEQYAHYVRSADSGALRQLFYAWSPTLEGVLNTETRLGEMLTALSIENRSNAHQAMAKVLGPVAEPILADLAATGRDVNGQWSLLVKRLGAALLLLKGEHRESLSAPWTTILMAARLAQDVGVKPVVDGGARLLQAFGPTVDGFMTWVKTTGRAIGAGNVAAIVNSPAIQNSGGLVPVVVLLLNTWNASNYVDQASALEGMDEQRANDTLSATLYWGAALVAVIDVQVRKGLGLDRFRIYRSAAPTLTLFGAVIGLLSFGAAETEFTSLQQQLEQSYGSVDPWLEIRQIAVGGQIAAYGAQALLGAAYTIRALLGIISVEAAIAGYSLWAGPIAWIIAALGVLYLVAWYLQRTPLQNFLNSCCWSKGRAQDLSPIDNKRREKELSHLYDILYAPRISFKAREDILPADNRDGIRYQSYIEALTIDLPGAQPNNVRLDVSMIGDPLDYQHWLEIRGGMFERPHPMRSMADHWLNNSRCEWIPAEQGQGLRISGPFKTVPRVLGSLPRSISLRLRYQTPLTLMLGASRFIGGARGMAFNVSPAEGVIVLRNDPTPTLDNAPVYKLGKKQCSVFLQPGGRA